MRDHSLTPAPFQVDPPTDAEKRVIMENLLSAWLAVPHLRLGQLLACSMTGAYTPALFTVSDDDLAVSVRVFASRAGKP